MTTTIDLSTSRILVIEDSAVIQEGFRKAFSTQRAPLMQPAQATRTRSALTGLPEFNVDYASLGHDGTEFARRARASQAPYAVVFVDTRTPSSGSSLETATKIWEQDPDVQIVICTTQSGPSYASLHSKPLHPDQLFFLRKPFEPAEVLQLANVLVEKWRLLRQDELRLQQLAGHTNERNHRPMESSKAAAGGRANETSDARRCRQIMVRDLQTALDEDQFIVHYQPMVDIASRRVVGLEALLRWQHPTLGFVAPIDFISAAEGSGLILPIGEYVLHTICKQLAAWSRQNVPMVPIAANISAVQLERGNLLDTVDRVLRKTGMAPSRLAIELTEDAFRGAAQRHANVLRRLRDEGVGIQLDDFGRGSLSVTNLKHLPIDGIKIDRTFITQLAAHSIDEAIIDTILGMARSLGLPVVAKGVETQNQLEILGKHGCQLAQGFYFCPPIPSDRCGNLLLNLSTRPAFAETLRIHDKDSGLNGLAKN